MTEPRRPADLVAASLASLERYEATRKALAADAGRPPAPGDVYALAGAGDGVEWVVLARDPADPGRCLVVPADANARAGSADVPLDDSPDAGALVLRCGFGTWIDGAVLDSALRTGLLSVRDLARARRASLDRSDGKVTGTPLAREVDDDPEYEDWLDDVVRPARAALAARSRPPSARMRKRSARTTKPATFLRLAASVVAVVGAALLWRATEQVHKLERELEERSASSGLLANFSQCLLHSKTARQHEIDDDDSLYLPAVSEAFTLTLFVEASYPEYRLEVRESDTERPVRDWTGLVRIRSSPVPGSEAVSVGVERGALPPGDYWLVLYGRRDSQEEKVAEYGLRLLHEPP